MKNEWYEKAKELSDEVSRLKAENKALNKALMELPSDFPATRMIEAVAQAASIDHKHSMIVIDKYKACSSRFGKDAWDRLIKNAPETECYPS